MDSLLFSNVLLFSLVSFVSYLALFITGLRDNEF